RFDLGKEGLAAHGDDVTMPGRLHESDPLGLNEARILGGAFGLNCVLRHLKNRFSNCAEGHRPVLADPAATMTRTTMTKTMACSKLGRRRQRLGCVNAVSDAATAFHGPVRAIKINDLGEMRIRFRFVLFKS